ncbi:hypothetical protein AB4144_44840, partial [Rhizobiaceae sp. 2RAB30]
IETAPRTAGRIGTEPGEASMTRHGIIQRSSAGAQPPVTDPRVSMVIADVDRRAAGSAPGRQHRAEAQRSGLPASIFALPGGGRAIADTSHRSKSP